MYVSGDIKQVSILCLNVLLFCRQAQSKVIYMVDNLLQKDLEFIADLAIYRFL